MDEEEDFIEIRMGNDLDADTAVVVQMAAHMLNGDGTQAYVRGLQVPLAAIGTVMTMAASMIASLAEQVAEHEDIPAEQVLLELRNWMEDSGETNG